MINTIANPPAVVALNRSPRAAATHLLVIDRRVPNLEQLLAGALHPWQVMVLSEVDGIEQISQQLSQGAYQHLAVVAHGEPGRLQLGSALLSRQTLAHYAPLIAEWGLSRIDLWSCQVAQDTAFVQRLAELSGATVAASTGVLGNGHWQLSGAVAPFEAATLASWTGTLAIPANPSFEAVPDYANWGIIPPTLAPGFTFESSATIDRTSSASTPTDGSAFAQLVIQSPLDGIPEGETAYGVAIESSLFALAAGESIGLDFRPFEDESVGSTDDTAVRIFLLNEDDSRAATLIDGTFSGDPGWLTAGVAAPTAGNYSLFIQVGSFDETFGRRIGAELYVDNIRSGVTPSLTGDIVDIDDTTGPVDPITVTFSGPIDPNSFGPEDLVLTRGEELGTNLIGPGVTVTQVGDTNTYLIGGLSDLTDDPGLYRLTLDTEGITTPDGTAAGFGNAFESWTVSEAPDVTPSVGYFHFLQYVQDSGLGDGRSIEFEPVEINDLQIPLLFDETYYLAQNPDVAAAVAAGQFATGYDHFVNFGWLESGRNPSILFDEAFYLAENPDVAATLAAGAFSSGFEHFVFFGNAEGRDPSALFDQSAYIDANPDVPIDIADGFFISGFDHYIEFGTVENRAPELIFFDDTYYLDTNPDVKAAVEAGLTSAFDHYVSFGQGEGRDPSSLFDESVYLQLNPGVAAAVSSGQFSSGFEHYIDFGRAEGRIAPMVAM